MAVKVILSEEPGIYWNKCPFITDGSRCEKRDGMSCHCVGGYYDSRTFDFSKCPFCTTLESALANLNGAEK